MNEYTMTEGKQSLNKQAKTINISTTEVGELVAGISQVLRESIKTAQPQSATVAGIKLNDAVNKRAERMRNFAAHIRNEVARGINTEVIVIPKIYFEYQPSFTVAINGCTIKIPADGKPYTIHSSFAAIIKNRMKRLDDKIAEMNEAKRNNSYGVAQIIR